MTTYYTPSSGPIDVTDAKLQQGWSQGNHNLDHGPLRQAVGPFVSFDDALQFFERVAGRKEFFVYFTDSNGTAWRYDSSYSLKIPGRSVAKFSYTS